MGAFAAFAILIIVVTVGALLPFGCLTFLVHYATQRRDDQFLSPFARACLFIVLVIIPVLLVLVASDFPAGYKGEKGHGWEYHVHDGIAGLVLLPVMIIAVISVAYSLWDDEYRETSWFNILMVITVASIMAWYTHAFTARRLATTEMLALPQLAYVSAIAGLNYMAFLVALLRSEDLKIFTLYNLFTTVLWSIFIYGSVQLKYQFAKHIYEQLPDAMPRGYGDCFIVSAAARGHRAVVHSWCHPETGIPVNQQLSTFYAFEDMLQESWPHLHSILRRYYNTIGPVIAKRIRSSWQADLVYILLKPLEMLIRGILS